MTTELDIVRPDSGAEIVSARPKAGTAAAAMDMLREQAEMMSMAYNLATSMVGTAMVPKIYQPKNDTDKEREKAAQNATAAILYGLELGLMPIQSLQQVFSVNNSPAIYARTMVALLKSKGYKFRTDEATAERCTVTGWWPGEDAETSTWDIERATKAGFVPQIDEATGKYKTKKFNGPSGSYEKLIGNEKYLTQPEEMLWAKAASTVCRRLAPDALLGIGRTVEDLESEPEPTPEPVRVPSERVSAADILAHGVLTREQAEKAAGISPQADLPAKCGEPISVTTEGLPPNPEQIAALGAALKADGLRTRKGQIADLSNHFGRTITDPEQLTMDEVTAYTAEVERRLLARQTANIAAEQGYVDTKATAAQVKALENALLGDNVTEAADRLEWVRNATQNPELASLDDLTGEQAKDMTKFLIEAQTADREKRGEK